MDGVRINQLNKTREQLRTWPYGPSISQCDLNRSIRAVGRITGSDVRYLRDHILAIRQRLDDIIVNNDLHPVVVDVNDPDYAVCIKTNLLRDLLGQITGCPLSQVDRAVVIIQKNIVSREPNIEARGWLERRLRWRAVGCVDIHRLNVSVRWLRSVCVDSFDLRGVLLEIASSTLGESAAWR